FEPVQRGVEGARLDLEQVVRLHADGLADAMAVLGPPLERSKDEHVERALEELKTPVIGAGCHSRRQSTALDVGWLRVVRNLRSWSLAGTDRSHNIQAPGRAVSSEARRRRIG